MKRILKDYISKKKMLVIIALLAFIAISGSYSWAKWGTKRTSMILTVGDTENIKVVLTPYQFSGSLDPVIDYKNEDYIEVTAINNKDTTGNIVLVYNINSIDKELITEGLKYTITKSNTLKGEYKEYKSGNFLNVKEKEPFYILDEKIDSKETTYYRVYVWIDSSKEDQSNLQGKNLNIELVAEITDLRTLQNGAEPNLDEGMIPVVIDNTGSALSIKTIFSNDEAWYDYPNKKWANAIVVKSSNRKNYIGTTGIKVNPSDILGYYVWIPRFKYRIADSDNPTSIDIRFETASSFVSTGNGVTTYKSHPAFNYDETEVDGFWVGKFETSEGTSSSAGNGYPVALPNVPSWRGQNVSSEYTVSKLLNSSNNPYGLSATIDSHMMKNSEWGAVAYLSHSNYGINQEIFTNNSSHYITGRSGGAVSGKTNSTILQYPNSNDNNETYPYGYYTWDGRIINYGGSIGEYVNDRTMGTMASTTGNITGVYDMSGGSKEYVMGVFGENNQIIHSGYTETDNSGFSGLIGNGTAFNGLIIDNKNNYNLYTTNSSKDACQKDICYGDALSETLGWYSDMSSFVKNNYPWITRGGSYNDATSAGIFNFYSTSGAARSDASFRTVILVK